MKVTLHRRHLTLWPESDVEEWYLQDSLDLNHGPGEHVLHFGGAGDQAGKRFYQLERLEPGEDDDA